ncbi:MAG: hypothetical protein IT159_06245 [Bryobacterales bacterium]|nr:hypothetical protein [Bryobacterales bacterium]
MRCATGLLACLLPGAPALAQPDYLPLQAGNQWIYRSSAGEIMSLEVARTGDFQGRTYFLLKGLPSGDYWLRRDEKGSVYAYDPDRAQEQLWYAFLNPIGEPYQTFLPGSMNSPAVITSNEALYWGPAGWFNWALEIRYPGVFQTGIARELFLPHVGLMYREQNAGGPAVVKWDLIYMRSGGVTYVNEESVSFGLTLDRYVYRTPGEIIARLTVRNHRWEPLELRFPSSQAFDLVLRDEKGEVVYRWSEGKAFLDVLRTERHGYGERNHAVLVPLMDKAGRALAPGKYSAEAWLSVTPPQAYSASAAFEIAAAN